MQISVVVSVCHVLGTISQPLCHEELITKADMPMQACLISQAAVADWKNRSIYRGDNWNINRIRCIPGDYVLKDRA
jgi:hypothetical protein